MLQCMDGGRPEDCESFAQLFTEEAVVRVPIAKVFKETYDGAKTFLKIYSSAVDTEGTVRTERFVLTLCANTRSLTNCDRIVCNITYQVRPGNALGGECGFEVRLFIF